MLHQSRSIHLTTFLLTSLAAVPVLAQDAAPAPAPTPEKTNETAPTVSEQGANGVIRDGNGETVITKDAIERHPAHTRLNSVIADTVAGVTTLPNGAIRIRGTHNQFSHYLDGAPLPTEFSSLGTERFNSKNIESVRVKTGAFPAQYGGSLGAILDIRSKSGKAGQPKGLLQGEFGNFSTRNGAIQYSDGDGKLGFFLSGVRNESDSFLSPFSANPFHNGGKENVGFGKFDYQINNRDLLTFHVGGQNARLDIPNSALAESLGQDNNLRENNSFFNAIWNRKNGNRDSTLSYYTHTELNRYIGSSTGNGAFTLVGTNGLITPSIAAPIEYGDAFFVSQRQRIRYTGVRGDISEQKGKNQRLSAGFDYRRGSGQLNFGLVTDSGFGPDIISPSPDPEEILSDNRALSSRDLGLYIQDDRQYGKLNVNYGVRYDEHRTGDNGNYKEFSPRVNLAYEASKSNSFFAYYNHLWSPAPIESVRKFYGDSALGWLEDANVRPESSDVYGLGWKKTSGKSVFTVDAYYKGIKNYLDAHDIGDTLLEVPVNKQRGIVRGLELSYSRPLSQRVAFNGTYGLSRGVAHSAIVGGVLGLSEMTFGNVLHDNDSTHSARVALNYTGNRTYGILVGQYESGLPYGIIEGGVSDPIVVNVKRLPSHFLLNAGIGRQLNNGMQVALNVNNILDKEFTLQGASSVRPSYFGRGRTITVKTSWNF
jgi:outer membrane receptor protein involved in Fe transport